MAIAPMMAISVMCLFMVALLLKALSNKIILLYPDNLEQKYLIGISIQFIVLWCKTPVVLLTSFTFLNYIEQILG